MIELNGTDEIGKLLDCVLIELNKLKELLEYNSEWLSVAETYERTRDFIDDIERIKGNL